MDFKTLREYVLKKKETAQDFPFGPGTLVFKVMGKMFALVGLDEDPLRINLKCEPDHAEVLRAIYPSVFPGYHMNKRHWNSVILDGSVPDEVILEMIDDSYTLVASGFKKSDRNRLLDE